MRASKVSLTVVAVLFTGLASQGGAQVSGRATGLTPTGLSCRNLTTGQSVVSTSGQLTVDCAALGLLFEPGDRLQLGVRGTVPSGEAKGPLQTSALPEDFVSHLIEDFDSLDGGSALPGDLDGDGDMDVVASNDFLWFENLRGPEPAFTKHLLSGPIATASAHFLIDVDKDDRLDIVAAFSVPGQYFWYQNQGGSPPSFLARPIGQRQGWTVTALDGGDVDGDGDTDFFVLMIKQGCCEEDLLWYENIGTGFVEHVIEEETFGTSSWMLPFDADGDLDVDLVFTDFADEELSWFENEGGSFTKKHLLHQGTFGFFRVGSGDLDGDGDEDLVGYERDAEELLRFENLGEGSFAAAEVILPLPGHDFNGISIADFSGDGRPDVVVGDSAPQLTWFENLGGMPPEFEQHVATVQHRTSFPVAGDINGDGRLDLVDTEISKFVWQENQIGLRLSVAGLDVRGFFCRNRTTGQTVRLATADAEIDCENEGLTVSPGDEIEVFARGQAQ